MDQASNSEFYGDQFQIENQRGASIAKNSSDENDGNPKTTNKIEGKTSLI